VAGQLRYQKNLHPFPGHNPAEEAGRKPLEESVVRAAPANANHHLRAFALLANHFGQDFWRVVHINIHRHDCLTTRMVEACTWCSILCEVA
jgi:hypothetical protein